MKRIYFGFNEWDASDLEAACFEGSLAEVENLLAAVDWSTEKTAPLHAAILGERDWTDRKRLIGLLLAAKSPVDGRAWGHAAQFRPDLLEVLPNPPLSSPETAPALNNALIELVKRKRPLDIPRLLALGASPNSPDDDGWTALHHACRHADLPTFRALQGAQEKLDARKSTNKGQTPLMILEASPMFQRNRVDGDIILAELKKVMGTA